MKGRSWIVTAALGLILAAIGLTMFSQGLRTVDVVGLFFTGMATGACLATALHARRTVR